MNIFDHQIITYVNRFSQNFWVFDSFIVFLSDNQLLKGGVLTTIIWWVWFKNEKHSSHNRKYIILTLFTSVVAMALAKTLALTLPFRLRPLHEKSLHFLPPHEMLPDVLGGWSSFPSDHTVLFFTLSTGLFFVSRRIGAFTLFYTTLFIAFPRVYLGLHYPTDIIAGAIIGTTIALLGNIYLVNNMFIQSIVNWSSSMPSLFYPLFFLLTYQIASLFDSSREIISWGLKFIRNIIA